MMIMQAQNEQERFDFARDLIIEAGDLALQYFGNLTGLSIMSKGARDIVSEADLAVENLIKERLLRITPTMPTSAKKQGT
jgi:myo-inositol-1(or 4)-monophosphatase